MSVFSALGETADGNQHGTLRPVLVVVSHGSLRLISRLWLSAFNHPVQLRCPPLQGRGIFPHPCLIHLLWRGAPKGRGGPPAMGITAASGPSCGRTGQTVFRIEKLSVYRTYPRSSPRAVARRCPRESYPVVFGGCQSCIVFDLKGAAWRISYFNPCSKLSPVSPKGQAPQK